MSKQNGKHNGKSRKPYGKGTSKLRRQERERVIERSNQQLEAAEANGHQGTSNRTQPSRPEKTSRKKFTGLFKDPKELHKDIALVQRASRSRWNVRRKGMIKRALESIVEHETTDPKAVTLAARALIQMNAQDQSDDHFDEKQRNPTPGTQVNVNVELGRSRILQLAERFGAAGIVIEGATIPTSELAGETVPTGGIQEGSS